MLAMNILAKIDISSHP